ncbi:hypothetical protein Ais01nite_21420 [Asanoa ishikariensis]|uniref:RNA polymerase sigma-70 factor, ECF subfamily n=1 Tax=Asanoa ishikariensis TaxID=137265 RepID=A0A1H3U8H4_9ACTN|nr:sigma-70 family RNA polymerase sigma factor [Asanoa ishikariensis]GIF64107.1 hypothetical protein Ais01nite_21420 [Asanoa ishikariensis]SDZ58587.1 RNA polymerase sigma-70 factor, ECF subfamily [Asanoa ishikariensis]
MASDPASYMREIHDDNRRSLLAFLRSLIPSHSFPTAEDLFQETMLRAWQHLDAVPPEPEGQRRWLFTVARRLVVDAHRRRQARPVQVILADAAWIHSRDDDQGAMVARLMLRHAVGSLSRAHRSVLSELYVHGNSFTETATRLGVPVGTVKSRAHYAMRSIREVLFEE